MQSKSVLVIGNGGIGRDDQGLFYVNSHIANFLTELSDDGFAVSYVSPLNPRVKGQHLQNAAIDTDRVGIIAINTANAVHKLLSIIRLYIHVLRADACYIFYPGTVGKLVAKICRMSKTPYGLYVRGALFDETDVTFDHADFILTVSPSLTETFRDRVPRVDTIRPMNDLTQADRAYRKPLDEAPETWSLLYVGNIARDKGVNELLEAAQELKAQNLPFHLTMVGGGQLFDSLSTHVETTGLASHVTMTGLISDKTELMSYYERADLFVFPTYHEGFPRVLYEAMIKGVPIITTMVGGIPGRMVDNENCIAIPIQSAAAIEEAILKLTSDLKLTHAIGEAGQATTLQILDHARHHHDLVEECLKALS